MGANSTNQNKPGIDSAETGGPGKKTRRPGKKTADAETGYLFCRACGHPTADADAQAVCPQCKQPQCPHAVMQ